VEAAMRFNQSDEGLSNAYTAKPFVRPASMMGLIYLRQAPCSTGDAVKHCHSHFPIWKWKINDETGSLWHLRYPLADGEKTA